MSKKFALVIGNSEYIDPGLAQLTAPGKDAQDFARVLKDQEIGSFDDVQVLLNEPEYVVREAIEDFFSQKKPEDLLILYFSGHGIRDDLGKLYLAVKNTNRFKLRATAIKSDYIREAMDQSRSKRQVLILDCCNSGAFELGTKAATGTSIGTASAFEGGYGRIILTASDSTQFAWEGEKIIGETSNSLFTHFLVKGLEGEADQDSNGRITVDELYDYAYEQVRLATPKQTPSKFSDKQQGEITIRENMRPEDIKQLPLPQDLIDEIEDTRPYVRGAAVQKLEKILKGKNIGLAHSAKEALEQIANEDDSRTISRAALDALRTNESVAKPITSLTEPIPKEVGTVSNMQQQVPQPPSTTQNNQSPFVFLRNILFFQKKAQSSIESFTKKRSVKLKGILSISIILVAIIGLAITLRILVIRIPIPEGAIPNLLISASRESLGSEQTFYENQDVYVHFTLYNVSPGTKYKARWFYKINDLGEGIYLLTWITSYTTEPRDETFWLPMLNPAKGAYRVEIYQDNILVSVEEFSVE